MTNARIDRRIEIRIRSRWFLLLAVAVSAVTATDASAAGSPTTRPNVVIVIADQWRAHAFGYAGDPNVKTPNIDALAGQSVNFVNAVSTIPVCTPMRATLLTGQHALTHGLFVNDAPLNPEAVTIAKVMSTAGYDTAHIGKWHVDGHGRSAFIPKERRQGFEYWKTLECTHDYNKSPYYADGPEQKVWEGYDAIAQTRDAGQYVKDHAKREKPFFMVLAWGPPHDPYMTAPQKYKDLYDPSKIQLRPNVPPAMREDAKKKATGYYAHCTALDDCIGELRESIRQAGIEDNTVVIFTADHGDLLGSHGAYNKQQPYDESVCVPFLVHYPAGFGREGKKLTAAIQTEDIMPTVLGLCGIETPKSVQGRSFAGHLRGGADPSDGASFVLCPAPFGQWTRPMGGREYRAVRTGRYTYARDLKGPWLLFDNQKDPYQQTNLVNQPESAAIQAELDATLQRKLKEAGDEFLPAEQYIAKWGYKTDKNGTIPYTK